MIVYYAIVVFVFGIVLGSFYNVVGYRLPKGESIIFPPSHCPNCSHEIKWYENIPLFSYIFQKGKCSKCHQKISLIYPIIELITGLSFSFSYLLYGFNIEFWIAIVLLSAFIIIVVSDVRYMIIPDEILIISLILLLGLSIFKYNISEISFKILDGIISFGIMYLIKLLGDFIFKKESLGGGDIKLMGLIGFVLGWELSIITIFLASALALPPASVALYIKKDHILAFGPFLCLACLILYFSNINIIQIMDFVLKL